MQTEKPLLPLDKKLKISSKKQTVSSDRLKHSLMTFVQNLPLNKISLRQPPKLSPMPKRREPLLSSLDKRQNLMLSPPSTIHSRQDMMNLKESSMRLVLLAQMKKQKRLVSKNNITPTLPSSMPSKPTEKPRREITNRSN